jgi:hypothetical protein
MTLILKYFCQQQKDSSINGKIIQGLVMPVRRFYHKFRIGLICREGRSLIGEFFQNREKWWGIGLWIDI